MIPGDTDEQVHPSSCNGTPSADARQRNVTPIFSCPYTHCPAPWRASSSSTSCPSRRSAIAAHDPSPLSRHAPFTHPLTPFAFSAAVLVHRYFPMFNRFCTCSPIVPWTAPGYTLSSIRRYALTGSERRTTQRFQMRLPLTVRWTTGAAVGETSTESRDVSSRGVYFFLSKDVREGSAVEILLTLPNEITLAGPVRVRCLGRVQRTEPRDEGAIGVVAAIERYEFLRGDDDSK
jgi:hypothetical protein